MPPFTDEAFIFLPGITICSQNFVHFGIKTEIGKLKCRVRHKKMSNPAFVSFLIKTFDYLCGHITFLKTQQDSQLLV